MKIGGIIIVLLIVISLNAQVEEFKMRQEIHSYQFKTQILGEINQAADIISTENCNLSPSFFNANLLKNSNHLYVFNQFPSSVNINSRGYIHQNTTSIDGVNFNSFASQSSISPHISMQMLEKAEILYGNNSLIYGNQSLGSNTTFYTPTLNKDSSERYRLNVGVLGSLNPLGLQPYIVGTIFGKNITSTTQLKYSEAENYTFGTNNPYKIVANSNSLHLAQKLQWLVNPYSRLIFYIQYSLLHPFPSYDRILSRKPFFNDSSYLFSNKQLLSYLKWIYTPEQSKWMTQMQLSISYHNTVQEHQTSLFNSLFSQNKTALQLNIYKNLNARNVFFYGADMSAEQIDFESYTTYNIPRIKAPIVQSGAYFKHEYRQSDNISLFWGARVGLDMLQMGFDSTLVNLLNSQPSIWKPNVSLNASWTRHSCESSNYALTANFTVRNPQLGDIQSDNVDYRHVPNPTIKPEKILGIESSIYRKIDDRLELHGVFYGNMTWDAIQMKWYNNYINVNGKVFQPLQQNNNSYLASLGTQIDIKYHLTPRWMAYGKLQYTISKGEESSSVWNDKPPLNAQVGMKVHAKKVLFNLWAQYNAAKTIASNTPSSYFYDIAPRNASSDYQFSEFLLFNSSLSLQFSKKIKILASIDNILNTSYLSYLSTLYGIGRNGMVEVRWEL